MQYSIINESLENKMLVRIRTNVGVWRIDNLDDGTATVNDIISGIQLTRPNVIFETVSTRKTVEASN